MLIMIMLLRYLIKTRLALYVNIALSIVLLLSSLLFLLPAQPAQALTPTEQKYCYDTLNGKSFGNTTVSSSVNNMMVTLDQPAGANNCVTASVCTRELVTVTLGTDYKYTCTNPTDSVIKSNDTTEVKPLVEKICGAIPASTGNLMDKYVTCQTNVYDVYYGTSTTSGCNYDKIDPVSRVQVSVDAAAKCVSSKIPAISQAAATTAIQSGRDARKAETNAQASNAAKHDCEFAVNTSGIDTPTGNTYTKNADGSFTCVPAPTTTTADNACGIPTTGFSDGILSWFMCPLSGGLKDFAKFLGNRVADLLYVSPNQTFDDRFKQGWNSFRNFGLGLVVIAGLVMVISQALGLEILDAYTIRKLMPRLAIALVGIALSWPLLQLLVTAVNDIGITIHDIILKPFLGVGYAKVGPGTPATEQFQLILNGFLEMITAGTLVAGAAIVLGFMGIMSLIASIGLALLIALVVLGVRQAVIALAVLMAPLAIASYVLPGTQKLWKFWKNTLLTSLMMFPIVMGFLAATEALSRVIAVTGNNFLALVVFFSGYAALPTAFKMAGGLMATITNMANDKNRGLFDRLKKVRGNKMSENWGKMKAGNRFRNNDPNSLAGRFNKRSKQAYDATQTFGLTKDARKRRREAYHSNHGFLVANQIRKEHGDMMGDDTVNNAILESGGDLSKVRSRLQELHAEGKFKGDVAAAVGTAERLMATGSKESVMAAIAMHNVSTGSGYKDQEHMLRTIANVSGGNTDLATKMLGAMRGEAKSVGRSDLVARFGAQQGTLMNELNRRSGGDNSGFTGDELSALALSSFNQTDMSTISRERPEAVRAHTKHMTNRIKELKSQPPETIAMDDGSEIDSHELADSLTAQLQNLKNQSREYGALDRAHVAHQATESIGNDASAIIGSEQRYVEQINQQTGAKEIVKIEVPIHSAEYRAHLASMGTQMGGLNDPNMQQPEPPKPPEQ